MNGLVLLAAAIAQSSPSSPPRSDWRDIEWQYETKETRGEGSSSSANGHELYRERVIAMRDGGVEFEYDLPANATADERKRSWQLPARVFKPKTGPMLLVNTPELEARLARWLKAGGIDRSACGRTVFTWTAIRIECDPHSIVVELAARGLPLEAVAEGNRIVDPAAARPGTVERATDGRLGVVFDVDPAKLRQARAEADVTVGEITGKLVARDAADAAHAKDDISGTIRIVFDCADAAGIPVARSRVTTTTIVDADGVVEKRVSTETLRYR